MSLRLRPAPDPVIVMITKQSIIECDVSFAYNKLRAISGDPYKAVEFCGRLVLVIDGYDHDPRELFEIQEVRAYVAKLDAAWPYWYFFLNQASESFQLVESCLVETIEVAPGVASIDVDGFSISMARHMEAMEKYAMAINYPDDKVAMIRDGIEQMFSNAQVDEMSGDAYQ